MSKSLNLKTRYFHINPPLRYEFETYKAELDKSAFLVIDVYGIGIGFHTDDQIIQEEQLKIVKNSLLPALNVARKIGMKVVYVNNSAPKINLADSEFGKLTKRTFSGDIERVFAEDNVDPREYHYGDSDHLKISKLLQPKDNEYFIRKHVYSGFVGTRLDFLLRYLGIHNLFVVGFFANACLFTTVVDALWHNYKCILLRDCTSSGCEGDDYKEVAESLGTESMIKLMESLYCVSITSNEFIESTNKLVE
jgi:nicotinamidase-related amidase